MTKPKPPRSTRTKTTPKSTTVAKRVPAHGRGALNVGGTPGNAGGWGRPPDELRGLSRDAFHGLIVEIKRRIDAGELHDADLSELGSLLGVTGKFGIGEKVVLEWTSAEVQQRLQQIVDVIVSRETWPSRELLDTLDPVFR